MPEQYSYGDLEQPKPKTSSYSYGDLESPATSSKGPKPPEELLSLPDRLYGWTRVTASAMSPPGSYDAFGKAMDVGTGAVKEVGSTAYDIIRKVPLWRDLLPSEKPDFLKPEGTAQKLGAAGAIAAEYAVPAAAVGGLPAIAGAPALGRVGVQTLVTGAVSKLRNESNPEVLRDMLIVGGLSGAGELLNKAAIPLGERIEQALVKPLQRELGQVKAPPEEAGKTMIQNLYKWDLGGTLPQSYQKATARLNDLGQQLRATLAKNPAATVDLHQVLTEAATDLSKGNVKTFGMNKEIATQLAKMGEEIELLGSKGTVNLADANEIKQAIGLMGSWTNLQRTADSTAMETVANTLYSKLRVAIEKGAGAAGSEIQGLNQAMSEIIPIRNAVLRRLPVAERREILSLKEAFALAHGNLPGLALAASDRAMRSGTVANALVQYGQRGVFPRWVGPGTAGTLTASPASMPVPIPQPAQP